MIAETWARECSDPTALRPSEGCGCAPGHSAGALGRQATAAAKLLVCPLKGLRGWMIRSISSKNGSSKSVSVAAGSSTRQSVNSLAAYSLHVTVSRPSSLPSTPPLHSILPFCCAQWWTALPWLRTEWHCLWMGPTTRSMSFSACATGLPVAQASRNTDLPITLGNYHELPTHPCAHQRAHLQRAVPTAQLSEGQGLPIRGQATGVGLHPRAGPLAHWRHLQGSAEWPVGSAAWPVGSAGWPVGSAAGRVRDGSDK